MTVAELIKQLKTYPDELIVILSGDAEGNSFSPLSSVFSALYYPETTWNGWLVDEEEVDDEDEIADAVPCVVLSPIN